MRAFLQDQVTTSVPTTSCGGSLPPKSGTVRPADGSSIVRGMSFQGIRHFFVVARVLSRYTDNSGKPFRTHRKEVAGDLARPTSPFRGTRVVRQLDPSPGATHNASSRASTCGSAVPSGGDSQRLWPQSARGCWGGSKPIQVRSKRSQRRSARLWLRADRFRSFREVERVT